MQAVHAVSSYRSEDRIHYTVTDTGPKLIFTVPGHVPEILHFLLVIITFPFAG